MFDYSKVFKLDSFNSYQKTKNNWYLNFQKKLSKYHYDNCYEYKKLSNNLFSGFKNSSLEKIPFVHTSLFKDFKLKTIKNESLIKTYTSSGTSGKKLSVINVDYKTSLLQSKALKKIFDDFFKKEFDSIFFLDSRNTIKKNLTMSAKNLAIKGFSQVAKRSLFLKDNKGRVNLKVLQKYLRKNSDKSFIIFGFTSNIWFDLIELMVKKKIKFNKNNGILIHGGGWKKMEKEKISKKNLYSKILEYLGVKMVHNYYGMVEQTGSIFFECEKGFYHTSIFSEIFIRDLDLNISEKKQKGLIQLFSILPLSYPGHNILTEDLGILMGVDDCKCGRKGKYFLVEGRVANSEVRGCSDAV